MRIWIESLPDGLLHFPMLLTFLTLVATAVLIRLKKGWTGVWFLTLYIWAFAFATVYLAVYSQGKRVENDFYISFAVSAVWLFFVPWVWRFWKKHYPKSFVRRAVGIVCQVTGSIILAAGLGTFVAYNLKQVVVGIVVFVVSALASLALVSLLFCLLRFLGWLAEKLE